jgi:hypothetical protein
MVILTNTTFDPCGHVGAADDDGAAATEQRDALASSFCRRGGFQTTSEGKFHMSLANGERSRTTAKDIARVRIGRWGKESGHPVSR